MKNVLLVLSFLFLYTLKAQEKEPRLNFSLLRQNDVIDIKESKNLYQKLKHIRLSDKASLSFGGSYRFQTEAFINEQFNKNIDESDYWFLNRFMAHAHLKIFEKFEFYAELNSSLITSKFNLVPVDKDILSLNQIFARYYLDKNWSILLGRQNIRLGSGRLVDVREGPNVRLSFDMIQLQYKDANTEITSFHAIPVQPQEGEFDDNFLRDDEALSAIYWTQKWSDKTNTDVYLLYKTEKNKTWNLGTADDDRLSFGLRHFGKWKGLLYNNEFVYQLGKFGDLNINAWTVSFNIEKPFHFGTIGIKTEAISGDKSDSSSLGTFDGLYPRGAYFGRVARIGPSNLIDIHPYFETNINKINLQLDYVAFWRFSVEDGVYNPPLILEYPSINDSRFIGNQLGLIASYSLNKNLSIELESNIIFPGAFLIDSNLGDTLYHFVFTTELKL